MESSSLPPEVGKTRFRPAEKTAAMEIEILEDAEAVAQRAAAFIAAEARASVIERGRFIMAISGGSTPWQMLRALTKEDVPWKDVHLFQVDERIAPTGHPDRNLTHILESLGSESPLHRENIHAMPVESPDLDAAIASYTKQLTQIAGSPPILDLAHLGLGPDGHTASLVPGDPVLNITDVDVALTGNYQERKRITLTYPILNRSRRILWIANGTKKAPMLKRLREADPSIPAGRINQSNALIITDREATEPSRLD